MDTRSVGDLTIRTPNLDPRDLYPVNEPPVHELVEALVDGADWSALERDDVRIRLSHVVRTTLNGASWRGATLYGCRFEQVDLSGATLSRSAVDRCEFVGCRLTGINLTDTTLKDVTFDDCRFDYATLTGVRSTGPMAIIECDLDLARVIGSSLRHLVLRRCRLGDLELAGCDLRGADLRDNDLSRIIGIASLRGTTVSPQQLIELAATLPDELGLTVRDPDG